MQDYERQMEMIFIPAKNGYLKVFVFGFSRLGTFGNAIAEFNGIAARAKGINKKRTIIISIAKLNESLAKKGNNNE